jgi:hypothetical protein
MRLSRCSSRRIELLDVWAHYTGLSLEPLTTPPYLAAPPMLNPIDVGRQLFRTKVFGVIELRLVVDTTKRDSIN